MDNTFLVTGSLFADMVKGGAVNLRNNAQVVNDLNVFPIPDGDTGDNMGRTIEGGSVAAETGESLADIAKRMADGMLMSARGNSGVILSQFFDGVAKGFRDVERADIAQFAQAFLSGVKQAYSSVVKPTEGTILTVMREATEKAMKTVSEGDSIERFFDIFKDEMYRSLENTPNLLDVLKEAGVIDSGGAGFVYIIEGMDRVLRGETIQAANGAAPAVQTELDTSSFGVDTEMIFGYCTEVLLQLRSDKVDVEGYDVKTLIDYLESIGGESIVAFKTGTRIKLHVHTFEPEKVLAFCHTIGEFVTMKVENMSIQHSESIVDNRFARKEPEKAAHKEIGIVSVAQGDGIKEMFMQFGADYIVDGQQTMNPSTEDFITAFDAVNADKIIVLPNNSNIILAAKQAAELYEKAEVRVVPSTSIAEGYAAFTMLDLTSGDLDVICSELESAMQGVISAQVTYAVRNSVTGGFVIQQGDWLGFDGKKLIAVDDTCAEVACDLLGKVDMTDKEVIIAIMGKDATAEDMDKVRKFIQTHTSRVELYEVDGGQDIYPFIFAIE